MNRTLVSLCVLCLCFSTEQCPATWPQLTGIYTNQGVCYIHKEADPQWPITATLGSLLSQSELSVLAMKPLYGSLHHTHDPLHPHTQTHTHHCGGVAELWRCGGGWTLSTSCSVVFSCCPEESEAAWFYPSLHLSVFRVKHISYLVYLCLVAHS